MRHPFLTRTIAALIALIACTAVPVAQAQVLPAAVDVAPPPTIAYQGRLLEGTVGVTGARSFTFAILDSSGVELWQSGVQTLTVADGLYSAVLGTTGMTPLPASILGKAGLKLHVSVSGLVLTPDVDIVPAFQARSAWELVGSFSGDVTGTQNQTLVMKLQGMPLDLTTTPPSTGQALVFNGSKWVAGTVAGSVGPTGSQGPIGATGTQGAAGAQGPQGLVGFTGPAGVAGAVGAPGLSGLDGKTVLHGAGSPVLTGASGAMGDFYLDTTTSLFYGPKTGTTWVGLLGVSLVGPQGPAGGPVGPTGQAGPSGATGPQGLAGSVGPTGPMGLTGPFGATGPQGLLGPTGPQGVAGVAGQTIIAGQAVLNGTADPVPGTGANGDFYINILTNVLWGPKASGVWPVAGVNMVGPIGQQGVQGLAGAAGSIGISGVAGAQGPVGPQGLLGFQGLTGPIGATGATGPQGLAGSAGATGTTGATGSQGATGFTGTSGPQGSQGVQGVQGVVGNNGQVMVAGNAALSGTVDPTSGIGGNGDFYVNTSTNMLFGPKAGGVWPAGSVSIIGPQGQQGVQGVQGIQGGSGVNGVNGATGPQGPQGVTGSAGPQGVTGTNGQLLIAGNAALSGAMDPTAGVGSNGDFYVNNTTNMVFGPKVGGAWPSGSVSIIGPAGPQGSQGFNGSQGATGPVGAQGSVGATGATGIQGPLGLTGPIGAKGDTGIAGQTILAGKAVLNGAINPGAGAGIDGDFYINTTTNVLWGPKAAGIWPVSGVNLVGPQGPLGNQGPLGPQGPLGSTGATGLQGPLGATGPAGLSGATGATGAAGSQGAVGAIGATGIQGPIGSQGQQGVAGSNGQTLVAGNAALSGNIDPTAGVGADGNFYVNTTTNMLFGPKAGGAWPAGSVSIVGPQGQQGLQGIQGNQGLAGSNGINGATGPQGPQGSQGLTGVQGSTGTAGQLLIAGNAALSGGLDPTAGVGANGDFYVNTSTNMIFGPKAGGAWPSGSVSIVGPAGPQGLQGSNGLQGASGPAGAQGLVGATGPIGPQGLTGSNGTTGVTGPQGPIGFTGPIGPQGQAGPIGVTGTTGVQGVSGLVGPTGANGSTGAAGSQGATGSTGATGIQGSIGSQGTQGVAGSNGQTLVAGNAALSGSIDPTAGVGADGNFYVNNATNMLFGPKAGGAWPAGSVSIIGPQGQQGLQGIQGNQGLAGANGINGATGPQGPQGVAGPTGVQGSTGSAGQILIAGNAALSGGIDPTAGVGANGDFYVNTTANMIFGPKAGGAWPSGSVSIVGAAGSQGTQGANGLQGSTGPAGPQGLVGATGASGLQGLAGSAGATGATGLQGVTGLNGRTILNGVIAPIASQGVDGDFYLDTVASNFYGPKTAGAWPASVSLVGPAGTAGTSGAAGAAGAQGIQGIQGVQGNVGAAGASPFTLNGSVAYYTAGSMGLGTSTPDASALLDLTSTTKGLLAPRMTSAERGSIPSPAVGLVVYDTDVKDLMINTPTGWATPGSSAASGVTLVSGTAPVLVANGNTTPTISLPAASAGVSGYLSGADWSTFNAKGSGTVTGVTASAPLVSSGGATPNLTLSTVPLGSGGTGATDAASARASLGLGTAAELNTGTASGNIPVLDGTGKLPSSLVPISGLTYKGSQTLAGDPTVPIEVSGNYYIISVAGTEHSSGLGFNPGDWMISNGVAWDKITNSVAVASVAGKTGVVTLSSADLTDVNLSGNGLGKVLAWTGTAWAPTSAASGTVTAVTVGTGLNVTNGTTTPAITLGTVPLASGGTGATTASGARSSLGAAASGANSDITSLAGLSTALTLGQGGTGATSATAALGNLLPSQAGNGGKVLSTNGSAVGWTVAASGTVTGVTASAPLSITGSASAPNVTLSGALPVANGGTGATTLTGVLHGNGTSAVTAGSVNLASDISGILPVANGGTGVSSLGANGTVFTSNGSSASWTAPTGGGGGSTFTATASGALNIGDLVEFNADGTVKSIINTISGNATAVSSFTAGQTVTGVGVSATPSLITATMVGTDKVVLFYSQAGGGYVVAGTLAGTSVTWGTPALVMAAGQYINSICAVETDKFAVMWRDGSNYGYLVMGKIVGNAITLGTQWPGSFSSGAGDYQVVSLGNNHLGVGPSNGLYPYVMYYNSATLAVTVGGNVGMFGTNFAQHSTVQVDTDKFLYGGVWTTGELMFYNMIVSGTTSPTLSYSNSIVTTTGGLVGNGKIVKISTSSNPGTFLAVYAKSGVWAARAFTITTGNGLAWLTSEVSLAAYNLYADSLGLANTADMVAVVTGSTTVSNLVALPISVSGTTLTVGTPTTLVATGNYRNAAAFTTPANGSNGRFVVAYADSTNANKPYVAAGQMGNSTTVDRGNAIGVVTVGAANGGTATIALLGSNATGLSGLTPGALYYIQANGTLGTTVTSYYYGTATSSTSILGSAANNSGATVTVNESVASKVQSASGKTTVYTEFSQGDESVRVYANGSSSFFADGHTDSSLNVDRGMIYTAISIANLASGGAIGTAAATVDMGTMFNVAQTTAGQTITLPAPTNTKAGRMAYLCNTGSVAFTAYGGTVGTGASLHAVWNGTAWGSSSGGGSSSSNVKTYTSTGLASNGTVYELGSMAMVNAGTVAQIFLGPETTGAFPPSSLSVMRLTVGGTGYYQTTINNVRNDASVACGVAWSAAFGYNFSVIVDSAGRLYVKSTDTRFTYTATAIVYGP